jgi:acetyl-CoA acyltransferase
MSSGMAWRGAAGASKIGGMKIREAVIVDAVRTPLGRRDGMLKGWHPVDLLAHTLRGLVDRNKLDPAIIDDVICGCVMQVGEQGVNAGRNAVLAAGFPESVPATTVDRQCGSSQQAIHFAAQAVMAGSYDVAIACGVESMTRVPMGASVASGPGKPFGPEMMKRYHNSHFNQGISAEMMAERWALDRVSLDAYSLESHKRAARASDEGRFHRQILPVTVASDGEAKEVARDEGIRPDTTLEKMGTLKTVFKPDGVITAANSSQITDGAAAVLIMDREKAESLGLRPMAGIIALSLAAGDPVLMLAAPIPATRIVLERAGLKLDQIDLIEINEAFASVVLAWQKETSADLACVNVNGGAIALGHPLGASGARLATTLVHELQRTKGRYGLQTMCEGGGMANAMIIERL